MPLPEIAHVGDPAFGKRRAERPRFHHGAGFAAHVGHEFVHGCRIEGREAHIEAAHNFVGDRRPQEPDGRADPGIDRNEDLLDAQLFGNPAGMEGRRAAEGN